MYKRTRFAFECKHFRIAYDKTVKKPVKKIEAKKPKLIEERRIDTYA